ncbi:MAG: hypothetical protein ACLFPU_09340 [Dehalococcoidia bacterium]
MEQFKSALKAFIRESCEMLAAEPREQRTWVRIVREGGGRTSFPAETRDDFWATLFRFQMRNPANKMASFKPLVKDVQKKPQLRDTLLVDAGGEPIAPESAQESWLENRFVSLLYGYVSRANGFQFYDRIFNELFDAFQKDVFSPDITVTELSPLMNFEMESDQIQISDNLWLRQLSTDELEGWLNSERLLTVQPLSTHELLQLESAVEIMYQQERNSKSGSFEARKKVSLLLTAICLLTDGSPRLAFTKRSTSSFLTPGLGTSWGPLVHRLGRSAKVDKSQESDLVELYRKLWSSPNETKIRVALERWNSAADRATEEDKLIDYWIALESLFVPDSTEELSYRTALRIAAFLGSDGVERTQIYKQMKDSYRLRSEIVHGSIRKRKKNVGPTELIKLSRSYLRQALLRILESGRPFDPSKLETQLLEKE